jgi:hypothetical protein
MPTAHGATPASGTLTDTSGPVSYTAGPFAVANPTPVPVVDSGPECDNPVQPCDEFNLTVSLPSDYAETHPNDVARFTTGWTDTGTGQSDYDLYVYKGTVANTDGSEAAYTQSASSADPEITSIPVFDGTQTFTVVVVPYTPTAETVNVKIELASGSTSGGSGGSTSGFGGPTATQPGLPRYQILSPPDGSAADASSGEFNIGFDPKTGNIMTNSFGDVFRVTPPEKRTPALPQAGPALWQDVSPSIASLTSLDPILVTDQPTGRTFISNFTAGPSLLFATTDDDGATWNQTTIAPPTGGADHESIGVGPYPSPLAGLNPVYPNAVYYCSQSEDPDVCSRSDSGGQEFGPGVPATNGITDCSGLHGHIKVAPDGTVYLPNKSCGSLQGGAVSTDAGVTWNEFTVPNSGNSQSDPSIGIDKNNTVYDCYTPNDGSPHVAVSHDRGQTWSDDGRLQLVELHGPVVPLHRHHVRRRQDVDDGQRHAERSRAGRGRPLSRRHAFMRTEPQPARLQRDHHGRPRQRHVRLRRRLCHEHLHPGWRSPERLRGLRADRPPDRRQVALRAVRLERAGGAEGAVSRRHT